MFEGNQKNYENYDETQDIHLNGGGPFGDTAKLKFSKHPGGDGFAEGIGMRGPITASSSMMSDPLNMTVNVVELRDGVQNRARTGHILFNVKGLGKPMEGTVGSCPIWALNHELEFGAKERSSFNSVRQNVGGTGTWAGSDIFLGDDAGKEDENDLNSLQERVNRYRKRVRPIESSIVFPQNIDEFREKISFLGVQGSVLNKEVQENKYAIMDSSRFGGFGDGGSMIVNVAVQGRKNDIPNFWGQVNSGEEIGFAAVMTENMYPNYVGVVGNVIEDYPTPGPFLQVVPVINKKNKGLFCPIVYNNTQGNGNLVHKVTQQMEWQQRDVYVIEPDGSRRFATESDQRSVANGGTGLVPMVDFSSKPKRLTGRNVPLIQVQAVVNGFYMKLGNVMIMPTPVPSQTEIMRALRSYQDYDLHASKYPLHVMITPGSGLPGCPLG